MNLAAFSICNRGQQLINILAHERRKSHQNEKDYPQSVTTRQCCQDHFSPQPYDIHNYSALQSKPSASRLRQKISNLIIVVSDGVFA